MALKRNENKESQIDVSKMERTFNNMGYMFKDLTEYCEDFIRFSETSKGPVLEIGAAFGFVSLQVADKGVKIWANDLDSRHLDFLEKKATKAQREFITTVACRFPDESNFPAEFFSAIFSSNVFHFLRGEEITQGIKKMFSWIKPGGKVYITAGTPYAYHWQEFIPIFEEKIKKGLPWPGQIEDFSIFKHNKRLSELPHFFHFFSPQILESAFKKFGFIPEKSGYCSRKNWPKDLRFDGRETAGLVARKPLYSTSSLHKKA